MSALPRGRCGTCGQGVPIRRNGALREHRVRLSQLEQRPELGIAGTHRLCAGSGEKAEAER